MWGEHEAGGLGAGWGHGDLDFVLQGRGAEARPAPWTESVLAGPQGISSRPSWVSLPSFACDLAGRSGPPGWPLPHQPVGAGGHEQMGGGRPASLLQQPPRRQEAGPQPLGPQPAARSPHPEPPRPAGLVTSAGPAGGNGAGVGRNENELGGLLGCMGFSGPQFPQSKPRAGNQMIPNSQRHRGVAWSPESPAGQSSQRGLVLPRPLPRGQGASKLRPFSRSL